VTVTGHAHKWLSRFVFVFGNKNVKQQAKLLQKVQSIRFDCTRVKRRSCLISDKGDHISVARSRQLFSVSGCGDVSTALCSDVLVLAALGFFQGFWLVGLVEGVRYVRGVWHQEGRLVLVGRETPVLSWFDRE
jgi:hypothetical protein